jgi:hypothetical protein
MKTFTDRTFPLNSALALSPTDHKCLSDAGHRLLKSQDGLADESHDALMMLAV